MAETLFIIYMADRAAARDLYATALAAKPALDEPGMTEFALGEGAALGLMAAAGVPRAEF